MKDRWVRLTALLAGGIVGGWGGGLWIERLPWLSLRGWANWRGQVLAGFITAGLAVILVPWLVRQLTGGVRHLLAWVQRVPMRDMVFATAGLIAGLVVALLLTAALPPIPWVGPYLRLGVTVLAGYLGLMVAVRKKDEGAPLWVGYPHPTANTPALGSNRGKAGALVAAVSTPTAVIGSARAQMEVAQLAVGTGPEPGQGRRLGEVEPTTGAASQVVPESSFSGNAGNGGLVRGEGGRRTSAARGGRGPAGSVPAWAEEPGMTALRTATAKGAVAKLLDTSAIIDGRIADVAATGFLEGPLVVPGFVIAELQRLADSADPLKRNRGRRGLDLLAQMRQELPVDVIILEDIPDGNSDVDLELVRLARQLGARVVTNDYNLNKVARLHEVAVLNLNDLANAVKPVVLPGEEMEVRILRDGKEQGQGVGYLDDGTMIVVDGGREFVGRPVTVCVTSVLQTSAGRMIFARPKGSGERVGQASNA